MRWFMLISSLWAFLLFPNAVSGQPIAMSATTEKPALRTVLLPDAVLESSATRFPDILAAIARERAARGDVQSAEGAFDLVFNADGFDRVSGFWTGRVLNTEARQNLRAFGASVYGGYRISDGTFPIYEDINFTNTGGEFKVGALFSLLRDRKIDSRRFRVADATLAANQASLDVMLTQVGVQQKALNAYWRWVATGRELIVYRGLLDIAEARAAGLDEQVRKGAKPEIAIVENQQNIIRRRVFVTEAERNFAVAANALSFFFRDEADSLVAPSLEQLPPKIILPALENTTPYDTSKVNDALAGRPELRSLQIAIERAENEVALGENSLKPKLDLNFEVSRDLGNIAEGGISRDSTDTIIGFRFSVPLQRREARGRLSRANAQLRAARLQERRVEDQIEVELRNILTDLNAALTLSKLAESEVEQSEAMVEAERQRFNLGASDFFFVNIREERAADAQIRAIRADFNGRIARTSYDAATVNIESLGL